MAHKANRGQHIDSVIALTSKDSVCTPPLGKEELITESWARCVNTYRLDPSRPREARILPFAQLQEHRESVERFLRVARFGIEQLYQQIAGLGYVLLLTDRDGVAVDYIGDRHHEKELRQAGLYLGSDWNESHAGTCGVGTALVAGRAFICHQTDHFDATHIDLTCTVSPLFDCYGGVQGVLDISALFSPQPKSSQYMALQLVKVHAQKIENANFIDQFRHHWTLRLGTTPEFVDIDPECLLAIDSAGAIMGFNRNMQALLSRQIEPGESILGRSIESFFACRIDDIPRLIDIDDGHSRMLYSLRTRERWYAAVEAPRRRNERHAVEAARRVESLPEGVSGIVEGDPALSRAIGRALRLIKGKVNVLFGGETGTGKEYLARALHHSSVRADKAFVAINCAALPESLLESELFGYTRGAFTGAERQGKLGLIQQAEGGTLFLDEIGDMPLSMQARLLRVLAQQEVHPIGAERPIPIDLYVMSATHRDLPTLIAEGHFREDLYYRLNGFSLDLPPLRERADLRVLVARILRELCADRHSVPTVSAEAFALLEAYDWPGNVRELSHALQFAVAVAGDTDVLRVDDLPERLSRPVKSRSVETVIERPRRSGEAGALLRVLQAHQWNITSVAKALGVARITVYRRMERFDLVPPNQRDALKR